MSYYYGKQQVKEKILEIFPETPIRILDIGAGIGIYADYLEKICVIDAIEIYEPYVLKCNLNEKYHQVFICNALDFDYKIDEYDVVILGDIIEHLSIDNAKKLLNNIYDKFKLIILSIPYETTQNIRGENIYQRHLQDDLTHEKFNERYPGFEVLIKGPKYGYYYSYRKGV